MDNAGLPALSQLGISVDGVPCTVVVTVDADPETLPGLADHARFGLEAFRTFPGYLGGALHVSQDGRRLIQYLQWSSEEAYRACIDDPAWDEHLSTRRFLAAARSGAAHVDARVVKVDRVVGAEREGS